MAVVSKPVMYGCIVAVAAGLVYYFQGDAPPAKKADTAAAKKPLAASVTTNDFKPEDFTARFARLKEKPKNLFTQPHLGLPDKSPLFNPVSGIIVKIPASLADGDPGWIYTGIAVINDVKMALLENGSKHLAEYATEGKPWKSSKVRRVSADGIALVPKDGGTEQVVLRYDSSLEKAASAPGGPPTTLPPVPNVQPNQPVAPMVGSIGDNLQIRPRRRRGSSSSFVISQ